MATFAVSTTKDTDQGDGAGLERLLRQLLETTDALVIVLDRTGRIVVFNKACEHVTGYGMREVRGKLLWDCFPDPAQAQPMRWLFSDLGGATAPRRHEANWIAKDGTRRRIAWRVASVCDGHGQVEYMIGTGIDVTGQRAVEQALRESEERFRRLSDLSLEGIAIHDGHVILDVNSTFARMHGYDLAEVIGMDVLKVIAPDWHARATMNIQGNNPGPYECVNVRKDGTNFPSEIQGREIWREGRCLRAAIVRDLTVRKHAENALRESEARLQAVIDNSSALIYLKDVNGCYLLANQRFRELVGKDAGEIVGKTDEQVTGKAIAEARAANDAKLLAAGESVKFEEVVTLGDGSKRTFLSVQFPLRDAAGEIYAIGGIATDITERKRMEEALQGAKEAAVLASHAKSEFLANVSHELRTPLNAILGFSEMIRDQMFGAVGESRYLEYADDIHSSGSHLLNLINDILDLSKVEMGQMELEEGEVGIAELIESCILLIRRRAEEAGIEIRVDLPRRPPTLRADERKLKQILINLLSNAVKFTPAGGRLEVRAGFDEAGRFALAVSDTGIGIEPEDVAKALAPFGQVENSLTRRHEGTGLGLPLARMLVELHGGTLELMSEVDVGTTVRIVFPSERVLPPAG